MKKHTVTGSGFRVTREVSSKYRVPGSKGRVPGAGYGIAVFAALLLVSFVFIYKTNISRHVNIYDEGNVLYGSEMAAGGAVPYRDFWSIYTPGQYYCIAALYKIFGTSINTERAWDILLRTAIAMAVFFIAWRLSNIYFALISWLTCALWLGFWEWPGIPSIPAVLLCVLAVEFLRRYFTGGKTADLTVAAALNGAAMLFRHDFGIYVFISAVLVIVYNGISKKEKKPSWPKEILFFCAGIFAVVFIPALLLLISAGPAGLFYDLFIYPVAVLPPYRSLAFPKLSGGGNAFFNNFPFYYPFIIYLLSGFFLIKQLLAVKGKDLKAGKSYAISVMPALLTGLFLFAQLKNRPDLVHLQPFLIFAVLLQGYLYACIMRLPNRGKYALLAFVFAANILVLAGPVKDELNRLEMPAPQASRLERAGNAAVPADMAAAINFIQAKVPENAYMFVGNTSHDRIIFNNTAFYFLAERKSATKYFSLDPGSAGTPQVQADIIGSLKSRNVAYIVLYAGSDNYREPNKTSISSGCFDLDRYIRGNYAKVWELGVYSVWEAK